MVKVTVTHHAVERVEKRLGKLTNWEEVELAVYNAIPKLQFGENHIVIKKFSYRIYLGDRTKRSTPKGDVVVAVVHVDERGGRLATVMLRKSTSISQNTCNYIR